MPKPLTEYFPTEVKPRIKKKKPKVVRTYSDRRSVTLTSEERCPHSSRADALRAECSLCAGVEAVTVRPGPVVPYDDILDVEVEFDEGNAEHDSE